VRIARTTVANVACWVAFTFHAVSLFASEPTTGIITTHAGSGAYGFSGDGAAATAAQMRSPAGVATDAAGNVYIVDKGNNRIRKVAAASGVITTFAGNGSYGFSGDGGAATSARLADPAEIAIDGAGNLYIADAGNHRIRKITAATGVITTVAGSGTPGYGGDGSVATAAQLDAPEGVAIDGAGNLYIADTDNHRVRKVAAGSGVITTLAGSGVYGFSGDGAAAIAAQMRSPNAVAVDGAGNVYISDANNERIRKVDAADGNITTVAGTGSWGFSGEGGAATSATLNAPSGLAVDAAGNVFVADTGNHRIRKITVSTGLITTIAGSGTHGFGGDGGAATAAQLDQPQAVAVDGAGNVYIADEANQRVRRVTAPTAPALLMTTIAGTGQYGFSGDGAAATAAHLRRPAGVAVDGAGNVYVADRDNNRIRKVTAATGVITTVAGNGSYGFGGDGGLATAAYLADPSGVAVDGAGNLYIADSSNNRIRKVAAANGVITTVAGSGTHGFGGDGGAATAAQLNFPQSVALDAAGNLYIADTDNNRIRRVSAATSIITTFAGSGTYGFSGDGAAAAAAQLRAPAGVAVDASGNVYIADSYNHRIRKVAAATGNITTVAGTGSWDYSGEARAATSAALGRPKGVAVDANGNFYVADTDNHRIRKVTIATGLITTIAGNGTADFGGDGGAATAAQIDAPCGVAVDAGGDVYIADSENYRVRAATAALGTPGSLAATAISATQVAISWGAVPNAMSYEIWRSSFNGAPTLVLTSSGTSATDAGLGSDVTYLYKVRAVRFAKTSAFTPIDPATTTVFTNPSLSGLVIRREHVTQLRTAVNAMRAAAGLPAASFTDPALAAGMVIKRLHVFELRGALDAARSTLGLPALSYTDAIAAGVTKVKAAHWIELRAGTQ
jgi:sugar lactone lactonase YvrE